MKQAAYILHAYVGLAAAHLRTALTQTQLSIPVIGGALALGTWQGIYLFEHRRRPHERRIALHVLGA